MFLFVYVCDLLEKLQGLHDARLLLPNDLITRTNDHVVHWLRQHSNKLNPFETDKDGVIRCLRPEKSFGWEYGLDTQRLEQIIARVLALSRQRYAELQRWQHDTSAGDLGVCVEKVMRDLVMLHLPFHMLRAYNHPGHTSKISHRLNQYERY